MKLSWLFATSLAACASNPLPGSPVQCGGSPCGTTQYCAEVCTCCGIDAGPPSGYDECREVPDACTEISDGPALAECLTRETGGQGDADKPLIVAFPCE